MGAFRTVLCAVEHGSAADVPLREADRFAAGHILHVLHVVPDLYPGVPMTPAASEASLLARERLARTVGDELAARLLAITGRDAGRARIIVEGGAPHTVIVAQARGVPADLVVIGARRTGGSAPAVAASQAMSHAGLGGVAASVVRDAPCSVLVVRPSAGASNKVLAATDFSPAGERAVARAIELARARGAALVLVHSAELLMPAVPLGDPGISPAVVIPGQSNDEVVRAAQQRLGKLLEHSGLPGEILVVDEPPATAVPRVAEAVGAALIVLGTSRKPGVRGLPSLLLGSVSGSVVKHAPCSVLVVRPLPED